MGSPSVAPPEGFELDEQPNAMRQGFGRLAIHPGNAMALVSELGSRLYGKYEALSKAALDSSPYGVVEGAGAAGRAVLDAQDRLQKNYKPGTAEFTNQDAHDALVAGPGTLSPGFARALGGSISELGAAGGQAAKTNWTPTMVRKLRELDGQFASETARGAKGAKIIENFREVFPEYQGSDANIKTMISRTKNWGGVNEATGAAEAAGSSESGFELGAFGGRRGARNMEAAGRPVPNQALDMAERMDAAGYDYDQIRRTVNEYIKRNDPHLGGVTQGADKQWRFEISDRNTGMTPELQKQVKSGAADTTLGQGFEHPELYQAYPELAGQSYQVQQVSKPITRGSYAAPVERSPELEAMVGPGPNGRVFASSNSPEGIRSVTLHEAAGHGVQAQEGFARGGPAYGAAKVDKDTAIDIMSSWQGQGSLTKHIAELQQAGELSEGLGKPSHIANRVNYWRLAGEAEAGLVQARRDMTPSQLRKVDPKLMQDIPEELQIVRGARTGDEAAVGGSGPNGRATSDDIVRIAKEMNVKAKVRVNPKNDTEYVQLTRYDEGGKSKMVVRVPTDEASHAGRRIPNDERVTLDTTDAAGKRIDRSIATNAAGERYNDIDNVRNAMSYHFARGAEDNPKKFTLVPPGKEPRYPYQKAAPEAPEPDPNQLKLLSGGVPPGFVLDDDNRNPMGQR